NMHTMKSSAAMMLVNNISIIAHTTEDLFYFLREAKPIHVDSSSLCDLVLEAIDFIKVELEKIKNGDQPDGNELPLIRELKAYLEILKLNNGQEVEEGQKELTQKSPQFYIGREKQAQVSNQNSFSVDIRFQKDCQMENIRAYMIIHNLQDLSKEFQHIPHDITENNDTAEIIKNDGFIIFFKTNKSFAEMEVFFNNAAHVEHFTLTQLANDDEYHSLTKRCNQPKDDVQEMVDKENQTNSPVQTKIISVSVQKLDKLLDIVGEMVISEAMVTQNPDLKGLPLDNFHKASRQLRKITSEIQDIVMSIRMVPLGPTFFKMNRIVRDMSKKLNKEVHLEIIGEDTEVDKNIIENLGDPLMHLVRNALDHGIESTDERIQNGKNRVGKLVLEAKNAGGEVLVIIKDDGRGLNKEKILEKASRNGLIHKDPEEMTEREIFNLIFLPGFSTKEQVTEFSGRGVGMDVVANNIEAVGGSIQVESIEGNSTTIMIKIPLTLAIIDGMNIKVGASMYTLPTTSIKESFRPKENDVFKDPDGNEMIMIRGNCYPILRLHQYYNVPTNVQEFQEGILVMVENENKTICLFVDELLGKQQVVVKALPDYIKRIKKVHGLAGCTLLGDGSISLILDVNGLIA
ncbi:MAG TPA: chemotaxis protein CheA, partial [Neobacillus sp.]